MVSDFQDWKKTGVISSNEKLLRMMQDLVDAYRLLNKIDSDYYIMAFDALVRDWYALSTIANARNIREYPRLYEPREAIS